MGGLVEKNLQNARTREKALEHVHFKEYKEKQAKELEKKKNSKKKNSKRKAVEESAARGKGKKRLSRCLSRCLRALALIHATRNTARTHVLSRNNRRRSRPICRNEC